MLERIAVAFILSVFVLIEG